MRKMRKQDKPDDFKKDCSLLCCYAKTFFGFGSWKAGCWLIGLEERGASECSGEFKDRYRAWKKLTRQWKKGDGLVDLRKFFKECNIKKPETPDWSNPTWCALRRLCVGAGLEVGGLCEHNPGWGGAVSKIRRGDKYVALIERMPFPAPSTASKDWPYKGWKHCTFMKSRSKCWGHFSQERLQRIFEKINQHLPRLAILYGELPESDEIQRLLPREKWIKAWKRKRWNVTFYRAEINHSPKDKSLVCLINHPNWYVRFRGGDSITELAARMKRHL